MASGQAGAVQPEPVHSKQTDTLTAKLSILQIQAEQRNRLLDEYFERTKLLQVVQDFMTNLATTFKVQLRLTANPYPELLKTIRMYELQQAFALESSNDASLDLMVLSGQTSAPAQFQVCSVEHEQFALPIWGLKSTLELLTGANLYGLVEQVNFALQGSVFYKDFIDDDCRATAYGVLVGDSIVGARVQELPRCFLELEIHVFVSGMHLEKTMAVFARFLLKQLHEAANAAAALMSLPTEEAADYRGCILCDGITITPLRSSELSSQDTTPSVWPIGRVKESRTAFITAVKTALVSNSLITLSRCDSAKLRDTDGSYLCQVEQTYFFHFIMEDSTKPIESKTVKSTTSRRSFLVGSRALSMGIFFHLQGAVEIAAGFQAEAQAAQEVEERKRQSLKIKKRVASSTTQAAIAVPERRQHRSGIFRVLHETIDSLRQMGLTSEVFRQQTNNLVGCFAFDLEHLIGAHQVLVSVLCDTKCAAATIVMVQACFDSLETWMERFLEGLSACPPTSVLQPVQSFLRHTYRDVKAASAFEDERQIEQFVEALRRVNQLLLIVIRVAFSDFLRLVRAATALSPAPATTNIPVEEELEKDSAILDEIDVLRALEMAVEERKYPASIVAEAVFSQAVIDSCLDIALESAVMNTVAVRLPPNPFIDMSNNLHVFALRQLVWRRELQPTPPKITTKIAMPGSLELFSMEGTNVFAVNSKLLEVVSHEKVIHAQEWLVDHHVFYEGAYKPPKSSYSAAIIPVMLIFHPLLFVKTNTNDGEQGVSLLQNLDTMEHYVFEGKEHVQARSFFMEAVNVDLRRLVVACGSPSTKNGKCWGLQVKAQVLDPHSHVVVTIDLSPSTTDEMLAAIIKEANDAQFLLQAVIQVAKVQTHGDESMLAVHKITKVYAFHHHCTDIHEAASSSTLLSPVSSFRLSKYGVFFSKENALLCLKSMESDGFHFRGDEISRDEWTPYASQALQLNDQLLLYELEVLRGTASQQQHHDSELKNRLIVDSNVCQLYLLEEAVRWVLDALQTKQQQLTSSRSRKGELSYALPPLKLFSLHHRLALQIISQMERLVVPLNHQLQFVHNISDSLDTLRKCVNRWQAIQPPTEEQLELQRKQKEHTPDVVLPTPREDATNVTSELVDSLRATWILVLFFRFSYQHAFFANANSK